MNQQSDPVEQKMQIEIIKQDDLSYVVMVLGEVADEFISREQADEYVFWLKGIYEAGRAEGRPNWISADEQLPQDGELVMFCAPEWKLWDVGTFRAEKGGYFETEATYGYDDEHHTYATPSMYWMPQKAISLPVGARLAEAPKETR